MGNLRAKLVFSYLLSCEKENIIYSSIKFTYLVIEFFKNRKTVVNRRNATDTKDITTSSTER